MARRAKAEKREIIPDPKFNSVVVAKFINRLMQEGQKATARRVMYGAMELSSEKLKQEPMAVFDLAIKNTTPLLQVKPRRVGGATYQVPVEVNPDRGLAMAMRWLINAARSRSGKSMAERLSAEFSEAAQNQGAAIKKREDTHKMAEANRAFAHYKW
jgi:small subunit ribosomal protein S7